MSKINFREFQDACITTWTYSEDPLKDELRIVLGILGELGELSEVEKKFHRGDEKYQDGEMMRDRVESELGDLLYYIAMKANLYDIDLDDVLVRNVLKLEDRKARGVIMGDGEDR